MSNLEDYELDAWIKSAVRPTLPMTREQQQRAWDRLQKKATLQTMLPPPATVMELLTSPVVVQEMAPARWRVACRVLLKVLFEEHHYNRAREHRQTVFYRDPAALGFGTIYAAFFYG